MPYVVAAIVGPVVTALSASIGVWWKDRRDRRDREKEHYRMLAQLREEIGVIEAWIKAYGLVVTPETKPQAWSRAENDLEHAYVRLAGLLEASRGAEERKTFHELFKVLLLIHSIHGRPAKLMRILYYVSLTAIATWISSTVAVAIAQPKGYGSLLTGFIVLAIISVLVSWGIYSLVRSLDRRATRTDATHPSPEVQIGSAVRPSP